MQKETMIAPVSNRILEIFILEQEMERDPRHRSLVGFENNLPVPVSVVANIILSGAHAVHYHHSSRPFGDSIIQISSW